MEDRRRCRARLSDGSRRCKKAAILGGTVCASHGGRAPQVRRSARERLDALVEPAIEALRQALEADDVRSIIRAAQIVLDRCGYGPGAKIEVAGNRVGTSEWLDWATNEELVTVRSIIKRATNRMEGGEPRWSEHRRA